MKGLQLLTLLTVIAIIHCIPSVNAQLPYIYNGFSGAEELAVGSTTSWKQHYRETYYATYDYFTPLTLTGFVSSYANRSDLTSSLRLVGVVDQLSISPLLTGTPMFHDDAMRLGLEPGLSGNAASGERARAMNAFRSRGVLLPIGEQDIVDMAQECASVLPLWNMSGDHQPTATTVKLSTLYTILTRMLTTGPNRAAEASVSDPLAAILAKLKVFNNGNTAGDAVAQDGADALSQPLSLVITESTTSKNDVVDSSGTTLLDYTQSPADAAAVGISCLLAQIRFSDPPLYSFESDGIVAQVISSIAIADGSFTSLVHHQANTSSTSQGDVGSIRAQKVIQELVRIDALEFHSQVQSISYFKTRNGASVNSGTLCTSGGTTNWANSLFCELFSSSSNADSSAEYFSKAAANFNDLAGKSIFNLREVFGHEGYGTPAYGKSTPASIRPAFVQESKASMYMSSNALVQEEVVVGVVGDGAGSGGFLSTPSSTDDEHLSLGTQQYHEDATTSTFHSTPSCLDQATPTCSPQGGLNIWGTTYLPPSASDNNNTGDGEQAMPVNGSIAVLVPISSGGMFHDGGIPGASGVAPDVAAVLAAVDSLSTGIFASLLQNVSLNEEEDAVLGQMYFFFLTGDEYGFMGSGRLVKEMESFTCRSASSDGRKERLSGNYTSPSRDAGVDCGFPFYWFTNFTSLNLDRFVHFISLEGILDNRAVDVENSGGVEDAPVSFYAYTDNRLSSTPSSSPFSSPNQLLVNNILSTLSSTLGESTNRTKFNISIVDFNKEMGVIGDTFLPTNATFQLLAAYDMPIPSSQSGDCSTSGATRHNVSIRTTIPPCSLWPLMASSSLASSSASEMISQVSISGNSNSSLSFLPPRWQAKSFTLITSRPPQFFIPSSIDKTVPATSPTSLDTAYPLIGGTLDTAVNLLLSSSSTDSVAAAKNRFDRVVSIVHVGSEILATLLTTLAIATNKPTESSPTVVESIQAVKWEEVGRLWYCLAVNTNCDASTTTAIPSEPAVPPNYYAGVFSYRWSIPRVQSFVSSYLSLRLTPPISPTSSPSAASATLKVSSDGCVTDDDCDNYYQTCQPTRLTLSTEDGTVLRCQYLRVQYTHSFSPAADYDAAYPALSRYVFDLAWIETDSFVNRTGAVDGGTIPSSGCYWANTLQIFDMSNAVTIGRLPIDAAGQVQQQHVVAVESFWGGDGIGVRTGAYLPKVSHYLSLMGGLLVFVVSLVAGGIAVKLDWIIERFALQK